MCTIAKLDDILLVRNDLDPLNSNILIPNAKLVGLDETWVEYRISRLPPFKHFQHFDLKMMLWYIDHAGNTSILGVSLRSYFCYLCINTITIMSISYNIFQAFRRRRRDHVWTIPLDFSWHNSNIHHWILQIHHILSISLQVV